MGMPCEVNTILKLTPLQGYPEYLHLGSQHQAFKEGYRIMPVDVPLPLVNESWLAHADIVIRELVWKNNQTTLVFEIQRLYDTPFSVK